MAILLQKISYLRYGSDKPFKWMHSITIHAIVSVVITQFLVISFRASSLYRRKNSPSVKYCRKRHKLLPPKIVQSRWLLKGFFNIMTSPDNETTTIKTSIISRLKSIDTATEK